MKHASSFLLLDKPETHRGHDLLDETVQLFLRSDFMNETGSGIYDNPGSDRNRHALFYTFGPDIL
ncbi:hypothetical protein FNH22_11055 [Fulvivirga sp. M361]|uniref:hypothetical protein n=1 Tax=Fulvivirga sp. M361 TaxID=2594266 RepID=UPI00117A6B55|nr:hypothetical protein [Fulvivirga sp. M361]TRX59058.1 hypothetical protein FNH22_11055 [Fulvivirga sp. M361]